MPLRSGLSNFLLNFFRVFDMCYCLLPYNGIKYCYGYCHIMTLSMPTTPLFAEVFFAVSAVSCMPLDIEITAAIRTKGDATTQKRIFGMFVIPGCLLFIAFQSPLDKGKGLTINNRRNGAIRQWNMLFNRTKDNPFCLAFLGEMLIPVCYCFACILLITQNCSYG